MCGCGQVLAGHDLCRLFRRRPRFIRIILHTLLCIRTYLSSLSMLNAQRYYSTVQRTYNIKMEKHVLWHTLLKKYNNNNMLPNSYFFQFYIYQLQCKCCHGIIPGWFQDQICWAWGDSNTRWVVRGHLTSQGQHACIKHLWYQSM